MYEWGSVSKADPTRIGYVRILRRQRSANFTAVLASGVFFYLIYGTVLVILTRTVCITFSLYFDMLPNSLAEYDLNMKKVGSG